MGASEYLTVGELARRVGVTVRTIQYYDQQGLLSPSAKGPQNQRLYTDDNVQVLYRILTLKDVYKRQGLRGETVWPDRA